MFRELNETKKTKLGKLNSFRDSELVGNVEEALRKEFSLSRAKINESFSFEKYQPLENIYDWIDDLTKQFQDFVTIFNVATSYENRPVKLMKISIKNSNNVTKPAIWIQSGLHGREWIGPATVIWMTQAVK